MGVSPLHVWAIIRLLPKMRRVVVNRFRKRSEAENCLQLLRRSAPQNNYTVVYLPPGELVKELADILEVIDAIANVHNIQRKQIQACQMQRRLDRGAFEHRLKLLWTEA
ncbi:hypothetical protein IQ260_13415 [Leptolyngbya cf. ectocarpi LEGE 11479]|uniref:Uncharacterized protein n=1 Tax=Leptolyngbya cf. ectocarpi LEGE 11479 TaxID=1828722 RepID=A0A928ZUG1_LEPEC|nr:hypothetical protein [Leptolyngbya ectocarpi]MBE9067654.1 hypothetical protein [Leptolyngbya cf. ectocarpi LEGE 11479]